MACRTLPFVPSLHKSHLGTFTCACGVAHVRMNQPQRHNAMTPAFWAEIPQLFRQLDEAGGVRAAVLSSVGKHFSAGMDLSVFANAGTLLGEDAAARANGPDAGAP